MIDYHYGINVLSLLNELAAHDTDEIHGGDFEVEGESPSGASGFATVDIPTLAEDAAKMIVSLQQKLDAMAAENAALKTANRIAINILNDEETMVTSLWASSVKKVEVLTPATDAYLNSVRADAVVEAAAHLADMAEGKSSHTAELIKSCGRAVFAYAAQLRSGTHDTADKAG